MLCRDSVYGSEAFPPIFCELSYGCFYGKYDNFGYCFSISMPPSLDGGATILTSAQPSAIEN